MIDPQELKPRMCKVLQFLLPFLVVALVWEAAAQLAASNQFPPVSELLGKLYDLTFDRGVLVDHFLGSMYRLILGYLMAIAAGVTLGMLMGISRNMSEAFSPALSLLISIPTIAWVPILLITLGLGGETVIAAVFLGGFFAITYSMMHGIRTVDRNLVNSARTMGGGRWSLFRHVLLPGSLTSLIPGLRLAIGYSWRALIGAEMLAAMVKWGLGKMIYEARFFNDVQVMFVGLAVVGIAGVIMDRVVLASVEKRTIERWGMVEES